MDREISFRGKRLDNGEWVYGSLIQMDEEGSQSFIFPFYKHASSLACDQIVSMFMVAIDPAAVGQFTGFCDKHGVRIFEGDKFTDPAGDIYTVKWEEDSGAWEFFSKDGSFLFVMECFDMFEVIGNIYDNPELLEEVEG